MKHTVAIMGLGVRGKTHLKGILENPDRYEVVGLCDIREDVMKAAGFSGLDNLEAEAWNKLLEAFSKETES